MKKNRPVTPGRVERALRFVAWLIAHHGMIECAPLMERLERELKVYQELRDPVSRARAILARYGQPLDEESASREPSDIVSLAVTTQLVCSQCGAAGAGSCCCGAAYGPAGQHATEVVAANPDKSDRAIAADIGVNKDTVRRARTGANAPVANQAIGRPRKSSGKPRKRRASAST
jgi:hypothetical protein